MTFIEGDYADSPSKETGLSRIVKIGVKERLIKERDNLEYRVAEINEALNLLDRNPDIEKLMDLIRN